jgi:crotonobetainyl-CoA:carnitine CoA-transferase CaiB-like acyl-CoA transferase
MAGERIVVSGMSGGAGGGESMSPQNIYRCAGEGEWVAIGCRDDGDFAALCRAMGRPELAEDARFGNLIWRYRNRDELDGIVAGWAREHSASAVAFVLVQAGVPVQRVMAPGSLREDEHLRARGLFERVAGRDGVVEIYGVPYDFSRTPAHVRLPAPAYGEHSGYVLRELLGVEGDSVVNPRL